MVMLLAHGPPLEYQALDHHQGSTNPQNLMPAGERRGGTSQTKIAVAIPFRSIQLPGRDQGKENVSSFIEEEPEAQRRHRPRLPLAMPGQCSAPYSAALFQGAFSLWRPFLLDPSQRGRPHISPNG